MPIPDVSGRTLAELHSLKGRVALVTGGARGIGAAIAARLAEAGATVVVADTNIDLATTTAEALVSRGADAAAVSMDVADRDTVDQEVAQVREKHGRIDILVNNAGLMGASMPLIEMDDELMDTLMRVNVRGAVNCTRAVAPGMIEAGAGVIVNIVSTAAFRVSNPGTLAYTASKHALHAVTKLAAIELGPHGIRVLDVAPTMVETPGLSELRAASAAKAAATGTTTKLADTQAFSFLPLGRPGVPDDVARVVAFAVSDAAAMMTGCTLAVDAGSMIVR